MELKDIIAKFEEILDKRLNEETLEPLVNPMVMKALEEAKKEFVFTPDEVAQREADVKKPTFSQYLGDLKRVSGGGVPLHVKEADWEQMFKMCQTGVNPEMLKALESRVVADMGEGIGVC